MDPLTITAIISGLTKVVPMAARWIGGDKAGKAAEKVVELAQSVTGATDPQDSVDIIHKDPAMAMEFRKALLAHESDLEELYLVDKQGSRQHDIEVRKINGGKNTRGDVLAFVAISGLIAVIIAAFFVEVQDGPARDILLLLSGALIAIVKEVYSHEFGSSKGSKNKDDQLAILLSSKSK